jgi:hypothetical protein
VSETAPGRIWRVTYEGEPFHLTVEEYDELRRLADDDPVRADQLSREYLAREIDEHEHEFVDVATLSGGVVERVCWCGATVSTSRVRA